jgi:hypothetical protein
VLSHTSILLVVCMNISYSRIFLLCNLGVNLSLRCNALRLYATLLIRYTAIDLL